MVLFGGGGSENVPLLFDSGRGGAPLVRFVLLLLLLGPLETCSVVCVTGGGYGRLGGGRAAGAGEGAGGAAVPGSGTGLALPPIPMGPLLSGGKPVDGKSAFRGTEGLVACPAPGKEDAKVAVVVVVVIP